MQMKDLVRMEGLVLQSLEFRVNAPTCFTFFSILGRHLQPTPKMVALASYILVHPQSQFVFKLPACMRACPVLLSIRQHCSSGCHLV